MNRLNRLKVKKILELQEAGVKIQAIARKLKISKNTVKRYLRLKGNIENSNDMYADPHIRTSKKAPKKSMSRHLQANRKRAEGLAKEQEMAGKRADLALSKYRERYLSSSKLEKGNILNEFCKMTNYNRKYTSRLLGAKESEKKERKERQKKYSPEAIAVIERIWEAADYPWSERLCALLPLWLPWAKTHMKWITEKHENEILDISARQIDRRLRDKKKKLSKKLYGRTKPGKLLKHQIPIKTDHWNITEPGYTEVDLVSHSGPNAAGEFIQSLNITDIYSGWVETMPIMGKSEIAVLQAIKEIRKELPCNLKGIDSDNGSEFINNLLLDYCNSGEKIQFTRSRPYKKDDNAHIEQKNWTHVRRIIGYGRHDTAYEQAMMKELYRKHLRLMMNLFQPSTKIIGKERIGSKLKRIYEKPQMPLDRLVTYYNNNNIPMPVAVLRLLKLRESLDPFKLSKEIEKMVTQIRDYKNTQKAKAV